MLATALLPVNAFHLAGISESAIEDMAETSVIQSVPTESVIAHAAAVHHQMSILEHSFLAVRRMGQETNIPSFEDILTQV